MGHGLAIGTNGFSLPARVVSLPLSATRSQSGDALSVRSCGAMEVIWSKYRRYSVLGYIMMTQPHDI